jgi:diguanylate cyclase (GGDEF)-like protein
MASTMLIKDHNSINDTFELLNICSTWILVRHQWLIDNMRSILTGENPPKLDDLIELNAVYSRNLALPKSLFNSFISAKSLLEASWAKVIKASHPMSGLTVFEQLNQYQQVAHQFMKQSKDANQQLWHEFSTRDTLTGALTRLTLNTCLSETLEHARRNKRPCAVVLLDQNNFKHINDEYGHLVGDQVLALTAEMLQKNLRQDDKLFRYGGDEWLILMPDTDRFNAKIIIERIQGVFTTHVFKANNDRTFFSNFSYGIAESDGYDAIDLLITDADYQLYAKKLKHKYSSNPDVIENQ